MKTAPFRQRPESVKPASVLGAFDGRVVDADTREPIEGAIVWCSWAFVRGIGDPAPEAVRTAETRTDPDGRYRIARLRDLPSGLSTRLARFSLVVYRKGYVAYRHDRVFGRIERRRDFAQTGNTVRLVRWSPELSHAQHLLFIGNAATLQRASAWEAAIASRQLAGERGAAALLGDPGDPGDMDVSSASTARATRRSSLAGLLLSSDDVREVTGFSGAFARTRLGRPGDATDTIHLRAVAQPERYDVAVRLWRLEDDLEARYEALLTSLPASKQTDEVGDRSFTTSQGEIVALGFMHRGRAALVLLTCGKGQCTDASHLRALATRAEKNLERLPPLDRDRAGSPLGEPPPATDEDEDEEDEAKREDEEEKEDGDE